MLITTPLDLRRNLYALFSSYGPIIDVVALRGLKNKGQAHIVFKEISGAQSALRGLQGFSFCGREIILEWARTTSRKIVELRAREMGGGLVSMDSDSTGPVGLVDNQGRLRSKAISTTNAVEESEEREDGMETDYIAQAGQAGAKRILEDVGHGEQREHKRFHPDTDP